MTTLLRGPRAVLRPATEEDLPRLLSILRGMLLDLLPEDLRDEP